MKLNRLFLIPLALGVAALSGCSNESAKEVNLNLRYVSANGTPVYTNNGVAQSQVARASRSVSHSLRDLSAIQIAKHPGVKVGEASRAGGPARRGSLNWNGPVGPAVARIASSAGLSLRVLGSKPSIPVIVNVTARRQALGTILQNLTFQANPGATIKVYPSQRLIDLRYNKQ